MSENCPNLIFLVSRLVISPRNLFIYFFSVFVYKSVGSKCRNTDVKKRETDMLSARSVDGAWRQLMMSVITSKESRLNLNNLPMSDLCF